MYPGPEFMRAEQNTLLQLAPQENRISSVKFKLAQDIWTLKFSSTSCAGVLSSASIKSGLEKKEKEKENSDPLTRPGSEWKNTPR